VVEEDTMAQKVHEVMTDNPLTVPSGTPLTEAARLMRDRDVGDVLVTDDGQLRGIVTDRDIVVRAVADARDLQSTTVGEVCSADPVVVGPDADADDVVVLMRTRAVRRVPVVDDRQRLVGVVSLGDMAVERDTRSALAEISAADPNN
jgi:CBS domain-containing protein